MLYTIDRWHLPAWSWWWLTVCHTYLWGRWRLPSSMVLMVTDCLPHLPVGQVTLTFQNGLDGDWLFATPTCEAGDAYLPAWSWWWLTATPTHGAGDTFQHGLDRDWLTTTPTCGAGDAYLPEWSWWWLTATPTCGAGDSYLPAWSWWWLTVWQSPRPPQTSPHRSSAASWKAWLLGVLPTLKADHIHCKYPQSPPKTASLA